MVLTMLSSGYAGQISHLQTVLVPDHQGGYYVEERGYFQSEIEGKEYLCPLVIRYPEMPDHWNRTLVIGLSDRPLVQIWFRWSDMDDLVGLYAVEQGFAYASVDLGSISLFKHDEELSRRFISHVHDHMTQRTTHAPERMLVAGLSGGGAIARIMAEEAAPVVDGALLMAATAGDLPYWLERQADIIRLWPDINPKEHPDLPDTDKRIAAYARAVGTPVAARDQWVWLGSNLTLERLRSQLAEYGLTDLTNDQVKNFRIASHKANTAFMANLASRNTTGHLRIPVIECVGTHDDLVYPEVLVYAGKAQQAAKLQKNDRYRLYRIDRVWHMGAGFDFWSSRGRTYRTYLQQALSDLNRWVREGVAPQPDRLLAPLDADAYPQDRIEKLAAERPLILTDLAVTPAFEQTMQSLRSEAERLKSPMIGTEHLLLALLYQPAIADTLGKKGMDPSSVRKRVLPGKMEKIPWSMRDELNNLTLVFRTIKPIDGVQEHEGKIRRLTRDRIALLTKDGIRMLPMDAITGQATFVLQSGQRNDYDAGELMEVWKRYYFDTLWVFKTSEPVAGQNEHVVSLREFTTEYFEGETEGKVYQIPHDLIIETGRLDIGQFWFNPSGVLSWSDEVRQVLKIAIEEARLSKAEKVDAWHLLYALVRLRKGEAKKFLDDYDIRYETIRPAVQ
jgi:hypothetical protein